MADDDLNESQRRLLSLLARISRDPVPDSPHPDRIPVRGAPGESQLILHPGVTELERVVAMADLAALRGAGLLAGSEPEADGTRAYRVTPQGFAAADHLAAEQPAQTLPQGSATMDRRSPGSLVASAGGTSNATLVLTSDRWFDKFPLDPLPGAIADSAARAALRTELEAHLDFFLSFERARGGPEDFVSDLMGSAIRLATEAIDEASKGPEVAKRVWDRLLVAWERTDTAKKLMIAATLYQVGSVDPHQLLRNVEAVAGIVGRLIGMA